MQEQRRPRFRITAMSAPFCGSGFVPYILRNVGNLFLLFARSFVLFIIAYIAAGQLARQASVSLTKKDIGTGT